jgi:hypothetical protein
VNGFNATQTGSARPIYKTAILNGKPVVRFSAASSQVMNLASAIPSLSQLVIFTVMKQAAPSTGNTVSSVGSSVATSAFGSLLNTDGRIYVANQTNIDSATNPDPTFFHVITTTITTVGTFYVDGTNVGDLGSGAFVNSVNFTKLGIANGAFSTGDIAEIIVYSGIVSSTDRANIEKYLGTKYGITVAGGTAADPSTVAGLVGWWKADSLL